MHWQISEKEPKVPRTRPESLADGDADAPHEGLSSSETVAVQPVEGDLLPYCGCRFGAKLKGGRETLMTNVRSSGSSRIVVGVDGSRQSRQALRWAAQFAAASGSSIEVVAAWQYPASYGWAAVPIEEWNPNRDMEKVLTDTVDEVFDGKRPDDLVLAVREGNTAKVLLEESKDAALLVVGSRGHGGFAGLLLGSVSASVAEHASCPVLVVHGSEPPPSTE